MGSGGSESPPPPRVVSNRVQSAFQLWRQSKSSTRRAVRLPVPSSRFLAALFCHCPHRPHVSGGLPLLCPHTPGVAGGNGRTEHRRALHRGPAKGRGRGWGDRGIRAVRVHGHGAQQCPAATHRPPQQCTACGLKPSTSTPPPKATLRPSAMAPGRGGHGGMGEFSFFSLRSKFLPRKSPRREVVRSSAGASVVYPPFLGSFA